MPTTSLTEGYGVVGVTGEGMPALVLQGHIDVVPEGEREKWEGRDPFGADVVGECCNPDPQFRNYEMPFGISIGRLRAGNWSSSVPERLVAEGRMGVQLGEDPAVVTWPGGQFASGSIDAQHEFINEVSASISDVREQVNLDEVIAVTRSLALLAVRRCGARW